MRTSLSLLFFSFLTLCQLTQGGNTGSRPKSSLNTKVVTRSILLELQAINSHPSIRSEQSASASPPVDLVRPDSEQKSLDTLLVDSKASGFANALVNIKWAVILNTHYWSLSFGITIPQYYKRDKDALKKLTEFYQVSNKIYEDAAQMKSMFKRNEDNDYLHALWKYYEIFNSIHKRIETLIDDYENFHVNVSYEQTIEDDVKFVRLSEITSLFDSMTSTLNDLYSFLENHKGDHWDGKKIVRIKAREYDEDFERFLKMKKLEYD